MMMNNVANNFTDTFIGDTDSKKPLGLIVVLENVGHIAGLNLPQWTMNVIDYVTEEYSKILLRLYGAYRRYDKVIILEDEQVNGPEITEALPKLSTVQSVSIGSQNLASLFFSVAGSKANPIAHLSKKVIESQIVSGV